MDSRTTGSTFNEATQADDQSPAGGGGGVGVSRGVPAGPEGKRPAPSAWTEGLTVLSCALVAG